MLANQHACLHKGRKLSMQWQARCLGHRIKAALRGDWRQHTTNVASKIKGYLGTDNPKEAWLCLKGWYHSATHQLPKPCHLTMTHLTKERTKLNARDPINFNLFPVLDEPPGDSKIRDGVWRLRNWRAAGAGGMHAEHLKEWLSSMVEEEEKGTEGMGNKWWLFKQWAQSI
jgi:hypothetical protein